MLPKHSYIATIWRLFPAKFQPVTSHELNELLVLGEYDRMRLSPAREWRDVIRLPDFADLRGFTTALPLIPLDGQEESAGTMADEFTKCAAADEETGSVLVFVQIQLSPAFFMAPEISNHFIFEKRFAYQKLLGATLAEWQQLCDLDLTCGYFCLSSVDLVIAVSVSSAAELSMVNEAAAEFANWRVSKMVSSFTDTPEDPRNSGHSFLSVRPTIVMPPKFRGKTGVWSGGVEIESLFTAECGHAKAVTQKLRSAVPDSRVTISNCGLHVTAAFSGLDSWAQAWHQISTDSDWFQGNILDVESRMICLKPPANADHAKATDHAKGEWYHDPELSKKLKRIEEQIEAAKSCLGAVAHHALVEVYSSFKHSFLSVQLVTSCVDLLPFFVELGNQCEALSKEQLDLPNISLRFSEVVSHLRKAIRNRTEHRNARRSEGLLVGPEQSHLKLLTSNSYLTRNCWKLLTSCIDSRTSKVRNRGPETSVCLSIGRAGFVQSVEPLVELGDDLRKRGVPAGRALIIESAGTQFTNPTFTPMYYFHELAEASHLMSSHGLERERREINQWIADCVAAVLSRGILRVWKHADPDLTDKTHEEFHRWAKEIAHGYLLLMLTRGPEVSNFRVPTLTHAFEKVLSSAEPTAFTKLLVGILRDSERNASAFRNLAEKALRDTSFRSARLGADMHAATRAFDHAYLTLTRSITRSEAAEFSYQLATQLIPDVIADFFALNAAHAILPGTDHRTRYFEKLLTAYADSYGRASEAVKGVVSRWAVFHYAAGHSHQEQDAFRKRVEAAVGEVKTDELFRQIGEHPLTRTDGMHSLQPGGWTLSRETDQVAAGLIRKLLQAGEETDGQMLPEMYEAAIPELYSSILRPANRQNQMPL